MGPWIRRVITVAVAALTVLAPVVGGLAVPASAGSGAGIEAATAVDEDTTVIERTRGNGTVVRV